MHRERTTARAPQAAVLAASLLLVTATSPAQDRSAEAAAEDTAAVTKALPSFPWEGHFVALTRLGNHWMPNFGDGDSVTLPFSIDQGQFPSLNGSDGFRETWYVPRDALGNTGPFYRHYSSSLGDHLDSPDPSIGLGFTQELTLGHPYTAPGDGLVAIHRYLKSSIFDHRTWLPTAPAGYATDAVWTTASSTPRYGYPRFANQLGEPAAITAGEAIGTVLENATLKLVFNPIYGNAISRITHKPTGKQIGTQNLGEMLQSTIYYGSGVAGPLLNPTQSGGVDGAAYGNTERYAGSPVIATSTSGTSPRTMVTTVRPLNISHSDFQRTDPWSPLAWRGQFRLTTTLGCKLGGTLRQDVIKRVHEAKLDPDEQIPTTVFNMNQVGWFESAPIGDCNSNQIRIERINLATGQIEDTQYPSCDQRVLYNNTVNRGVLVSNTANTFAIGFIRLGTSTLDQYSAWPRCGPSCALQHQNLVIESFEHRSINSSAWTAEEAFFVIGTPSAVLARMVEIYQDGGNCLS